MSMKLPMFIVACLEITSGESGCSCVTSSRLKSCSIKPFRAIFAATIQTTHINLHFLEGEMWLEIDAQGLESDVDQLLLEHLQSNPSLERIQSNEISRMIPLYVYLPSSLLTFYPFSSFNAQFHSKFYIFVFKKWIWAHRPQFFTPQLESHKFITSYSQMEGKSGFVMHLISMFKMDVLNQRTHKYKYKYTETHIYKKKNTTDQEYSKLCRRHSYLGF